MTHNNSNSLQNSSSTNDSQENFSLMFVLYQHLIEALGYTLEFDGTEEVWQTLAIDELSAFVAAKDIETDMKGFLQECQDIDRLIESFGFEV